MRRGCRSFVPAVMLTLLGHWPVAPASAQESYRGAPIITVLPKDAIPAIDRPEFLSIAETEKYMQGEELVISVRDGGSARAYSTWLLNHHEIVNDVVEGVPLAVTW